MAINQAPSRACTATDREILTDRTGGTIVQWMLFGAGATGEVNGSATATGRGLIELIAVVIVAGSCTVTGRGTVEVDAVILVSGSAEATGRGTIVLDAVVWAVGSAEATGHGTVEIHAVVSVVGSAEATGLGTAQLVAVVIAAGAAAATGRGTASCDAWVQEEGGASATATGRGFAWCRLVQVDPMARHFGTRAVRTSSTGLRWVSSTHSATRACGAEDDRLCGARRLN